MKHPLMVNDTNLCGANTDILSSESAVLWDVATKAQTPNTLGSPSTAVLTSCTRREHSCVQQGREFQGKWGFKAQSSLSVSRYGSGQLDRSTGDTAGREFKQFVVLAFTLSCKTFPSQYLNGHNKDSYQRQQTALTSCSTREYKVWTFQIPVSPHWAQQLWRPGSRWTNGTGRNHITSTLRPSSLTMQGFKQMWRNGYPPIWNIDENIQTAIGNILINPICVTGRNFSSKLFLRKMWRG